MLVAESAEHQFLSQCVTAVLSDLAQTRLYAYVEAERRKFDFACEVVRDWSRPLVGQTLWSHTSGVDKDLRTMLLDADAQICAYVARDTVKARRLVSEVVHDFRSRGELVAPHRLRVFWIPHDFDADDEQQRDLVTRLLRDCVGRDILMNVVFGNLTPEDVRGFLRIGGRPGLHLAVLHAISTSRDSRLRTQDLADQLGVSQGSIRERLVRLAGCGFLTQFGGVVMPDRVTLKGRVFLDLCGELQGQEEAGLLNAELLHILSLLDMRYAPSAVPNAASSLHLAGPFLTEVPEMATARLIATIATATANWGIQFNSIEHVIRPNEKMRGTMMETQIARLQTESSSYSP
jgi:hypothetical protein